MNLDLQTRNESKKDEEKVRLGNLKNLVDGIRVICDAPTERQIEENRVQGLRHQQIENKRNREAIE